jgi:toluene monooxygenase electron transfer component
VLITVQAKDSSATFECEPGERILHAGLRAGIDLPYECASGTCGTCKAQVVAGNADYHWPEAPGRKYVKAEKREILMCQCHPLADCSLVVARAVEHARDGARAATKTRAALRDFRLLTPDVCEFEVALETPITFDAGQFVLLERGAISGGRAYSMTNYGGDPTRLHFLVKRLQGGRFTEWLFTEDVEGAHVTVFGPLGRATFHPGVRRPLLMIAGGSGVAGFRAILTHACAEEYFKEFPGYLFFGVRTAADLFWGRELSSFVRASSNNLTVTVALSHEEPSEELSERYSGLQFASGFVHEVAARTMAGRYRDVMAYVAGPPPMVDASLRMLLLEARLSAANIRYDKFS